MFSNKNSRKRENKKFTIIIVPGDESDRTKSYVFGKLGLFFISIIIFLLVLLIAFLVLIYTPLGRLFPIINVELENKHNKQIVQIQEKLNKLVNEIILLRQYNIQLRKALGEKVTEFDTSIIVAKSNALMASDLQKRNDTDVEIEAFESQSSNLVGKDKKMSQSDISKSGVELPLAMPAFGIVTRGFEPHDGHLGIDISGKTGTLIYAPAPGTVIFANWTYNYGYMMIIAHGSGYRTVYKHNQQLLKNEGEFVKRGDPIAIIGNTGIESTGPHLHFEVWKDGNPLEPEKFVLNINN